MPAFDSGLIFGALGALFGALGALSCWRARGLSIQGRSFLLVGLLFCAVAAWLAWAR
jgi:hypothetical protein